MSEVATRTRILWKSDSQNVGQSIATGAKFTFNIRRLDDCSREFGGVPKSNSKPETIKKGVKVIADPVTAQHLKGHKFLLHREGRELPKFFRLSEKFVGLSQDTMVTFEDEPFIADADLNGDVYEATRMKVLMKKVLLFCHLLYVNEQDPNIIMFEVRTEPESSGAFLDALFQMGMEERAIDVCITETTDFEMK